MYRKSNSFGEGLYNLSQASEPNELFEAWASMNTSDDTRAVLSLDNYHKSSYPIGIKNLLNLKTVTSFLIFQVISCTL